MYAYCGNDPINRHDPSGYIWECFKAFVAEVSNAINTFKPLYATGGGLAIVDGPLPFGDLLGVVLFGVATIRVIGEAAYNTFTKAGSSSTEFEDAKSKGVPTDDHTVVPNNPKPKAQNRNPNAGNPNSSSDLLNEDGSVKQRRYYGPDGKPDFDIDFNHSGDETHVFPHSHTWDWGQTKPRLKWEPWSPIN